MSVLFNPLVSIIIPVFNGANYMREAIDSALAQTYANLEIIVVNDGSIDDGQTEAIAKSYGDKIRYFSKENGGCASALNLGIANMCGEYFSWLSHDDRYMPEKIDRQVKLLSKLDNKNTIIYGGYEIINSNSEPQGTMRPDLFLPPEKLNIPLLPLLRGLIHGCSLLIPKKYFDEVGTFNINLQTTQDYALWFDMFRISHLHFDPEILIQSRVHPDQGTHKIPQHIDECNALWSTFLQRLTEIEMSEMEGSPVIFLENTSQFLAKTPYKEAHQLAIKMAKEYQAFTKISVVIPFYNRISLTAEAVRSVLLQSHQQFEILLVDDGSTDDLDVLLGLIKTDPRIHYIRQDNAGPAKARNNGIKRATGAYIAFLDSDDLFYPEKLKIQLEYMQKKGLVISHTSYQRFDFEDNLIASISSGKVSGNIFPEIIASCEVALSSVMGRADIFKNNLFPENIEIGEDVCLWIKLASKYEFGGIDVAFTKVRVGHDTASFNKRKQEIGYINIAYFVIHDAFMAQFKPQIKLLLLGAVANISDYSEVQDVLRARKFPEGRYTKKVSLINKVSSFYAQHGFVTTARKVGAVISRHLSRR